MGLRPVTYVRRWREAAARIRELDQAFNREVKAARERLEAATAVQREVVEECKAALGRLVPGTSDRLRFIDGPTYGQKVYTLYRTPARVLALEETEIPQLTTLSFPDETEDVATETVAVADAVQAVS